MRDKCLSYFIFVWTLKEWDSLSLLGGLWPCCKTYHAMACQFMSYHLPSAQIHLSSEHPGCRLHDSVIEEGFWEAQVPSMHMPPHIRGDSDS